MNFSECFIILVIVRLLLPVQCQHEFSCGMGHATPEQLTELTRTVTAFRRSGEATNITIPVCSFIMTNRRNAKDITDEMLQNQMDFLNRAFSGESCCSESESWCNPDQCSVETEIRFAWAVVTPHGRLIDGFLTPNVTDEGACSYRLHRPMWVKTNPVGATLMKRRLRKGGTNVLNIYWSEPSYAIAYATLPISSQRKTDGVVMNPRSITGGTLPGFGRGGTLVHEVGHWLGLLHTFQGSCRTSDGIDDTPMEFGPYRGCGELPGYPLDRDSCPNSEGTDPVHNFMNYAGDTCWFEFTEGQALVMRASWDKFRATGTTALQEGEASEPILLIAQDRQLYSLITSDPVRCTASAKEGEVGLYLQWGRKPRFLSFPLVNSCSTHGVTDQSCTAKRPRGRDVLYVGVRAFFLPVTDLTVTCVKV